MDNRVVLLKNDELRPHEDIRYSRALVVLFWMLWAGRFQQPLLVDGKTKIILDGHHRWWVSKRLGLTYVPCYCVDYLADGTVVCEPRRKELPVTKEEVIFQATAGKVYPPKTTRHQYKSPVISAFHFSALA